MVYKLQPEEALYMKKRFGQVLQRYRHILFLWKYIFVLCLVGLINIWITGMENLLIKTMI